MYAHAQHRNTPCIEMGCPFARHPDHAVRQREHDTAHQTTLFVHNQNGQEKIKKKKKSDRHTGTQATNTTECGHTSQQ